MLKKTMKSVNFNGEEITEDLYFNLTKAELMELELGTSGGMAEKLQAIINTKDVPEIIKKFKEIILMSYGVKSEDGKRFIKSKELSDQFAQTQAYSDLYMLLATDSNEAAAFINAIIPDDNKLTPAQIAELQK